METMTPMCQTSKNSRALTPILNIRMEFAMVLGSAYAVQDSLGMIAQFETVPTIAQITDFVV